MAEQKPTRVLVMISERNTTYWERAWSTPEDIILPALEVLQTKKLVDYTNSEQPEFRLLAKQRWRTRVWLVFDISHTSYDASEGHLPEKNILPVLIVRLGKKSQAFSAEGPTRNQINEGVARLHNLTGPHSVPPFEVDYTLGAPCYSNARDVSLLW
ncbi:hypothetical protein N7528_004136 [Penicillium herquei]|nr:hypothetical protein N7528_004136 [Penicillium herquei]